MTTQPVLLIHGGAWAMPTTLLPPTNRKILSKITGDATMDAFGTKRGGGTLEGNPQVRSNGVTPRAFTG